MDRAAWERAKRRLPLLLMASSGAGSVAILVAALVLVFWGGHSQRSWLLMACAGVAAAGIVLLAVHRACTPLITGDDAVRQVLDEPVPGGAADHDTARPPAVLPRQPGRVSYVLATAAVATWAVVCGFVLAMADTGAPPEMRRLKEAGAVVDTLRVTGTDTRAEDAGEHKGKPRTLYNQMLTFDMPGEKGKRADPTRGRRSVYATSVGLSPYEVGDRIPVIYVPGRSDIVGYVGPSRKNDGVLEGYNGDVERLFAERALSGRQLGLAVVAWLIVMGLAVVTAVGVRNAKTLSLPGSRALRGTFRSGRIRGAGTELQLKGAEADFSDMSPALEGRHVWLCWDARRARGRLNKAKNGRPEEKWTVCPAAVVFDSGRVAYGHVEIHAPQRPDHLGVEAGGADAPLDATREVRIWQPHRTWPLTVGWGVLASLALSVLISAVLFSDLVQGFFPRLLLGVAGSAALVLGVVLRIPGGGRVR
ncbi:hypothetical protein F2B00_11140 [Streptomyces parvus]|uniref:hypothetical protein n=1 Tax=Streptomyces parvus TaxID=66428 RepID=UPI00123B3ED5|nr:hypothetical protein [Streptomyces parvus]KAA6202225.1 hypothetical protein F2B00_11140 [Streptomyces parvus]GGS18472.1 hypothetical protein GCM10010221_13900 [Streptomyces parvus]